MVKQSKFKPHHDQQTKVHPHRYKLIRIGLAVLFAGIILLAILRGDLFKFSYYTQPAVSPFTKCLLSLAVCLSTVAAVGMIWRLWLWRRYKSWQLPACCDLPDVSVIVPVYNEGAGILKTIKSVMNSHYPAEKLQVIVVNDGSNDDTGKWIKRCVEKYDDRILSLASERNCGKRAALLYGFKHTVGQILVSLDSDCVIDKNSLRQLIAPLIHDSQVGAVAGNICVLNNESGLIGKMLSVSFALAFDFNRAVQSTLRCVFCMPGAFCAYRADAVKPILDIWAKQSFCGRPAQIADDRALTNLLLKSSWDTVYQNTAIVRTLVPHNIKGLCRMYLRWARVDIRESIIYGISVFHTRKGRFAMKANGIFLLIVINMAAPYPILSWILVCAMQSPEVLLHVAAWTILGAGLPMGWYAWYYRTWDFTLCLIVIERLDRSTIHAETKHDRLNRQPSQVSLRAIGHFGLVYEAFAPANKSYSYTS